MLNGRGKYVLELVNYGSTFPTELLERLNDLIDTKCLEQGLTYCRSYDFAMIDFAITVPLLLKRD